MPDVQMDGQQPQTPNNKWEDGQWRFDGKWLPDVDGALIGPNNYQYIENLRYKDSGLEGVNGYTKVNTTAITTYTEINAGRQLRANRTQNSYILVHASSSGGQGRVFLNRTAPGSQGDFQTAAQVAAYTVPPLDTNGNEYFEDASSGLTGRFSDAPQGNIGYANGEETMIFGGDEQKCAAVFTVDSGGSANPVDVTEKANNTLSSTGNTFDLDPLGGNQPAMLVMTNRPIQGLTINVSSANSTASSLTVKTWTGAAFSADLVANDGTKPGTDSLAQSGYVTLSSHTLGTSKLKHFEELYLYAYAVELSAGSATISSVTVDFAMQPVQDVWDGVYRQPIQFQVLDDTVYYDYTLQVNEPSDVNAPVGADLEGNGTNATDKVYIMFVDQMAGIRFTLLGDLVNNSAVTMTMKYWDGSGTFQPVTIDDGTIGAATKSCSQSGLISWTPPTDEVATSRFGSFGYIYELDFSAALAQGATDPQVLVDICTGVPAPNTLPVFDFTAIYGTRLMLGAYSSGAEGNRMDYSVANAPDAFNGFDSSNNGRQSLYFGGVEPIVAATQIYNRFGSSVYAMLLVLKRNETYIVIGDTPDEFIIYDVAKTIGCVAPKSLATAEVGLEIGTAADVEGKGSGSGGLTRNVAIWLSHSGPMMFDGAVLSPIPGIRSYFDPNDSRNIDFSLISKAQGWIDPVYKEYNLIIPSGSATENNVWLVYDLLRRKWFTKSSGQAEFPQAGFEIADYDTGEKMVYGGIDTGFMVHMEEGTYWDDGTATGIQQRVKTGDFFPSNNIWDEVTIRKFKIYIKKLEDVSSTNTLSVNTFTNTEITAGAGVVFEDSDPTAGIGVDFTDIEDGVSWADIPTTVINLNLDVGLQRLIKIVQDLNLTGWAHAFEFSVTTDDVSKGFQPIAWGIRYRIERKDETATTTE